MEQYLIRYNALQLLLQIFICCMILFAHLDIISFFWVVMSILSSQVVAILEIYNAIKGKTHSKPLTSFIQVSARIGVSLSLFFYFSEHPIWIMSLLGVSWACSDIVRCAYYLKKESFTFAWARYNFFIVLYPLGMSLENAIVWKLLQSNAPQPLLIFLPFLTAYIFVAVKMYRHMLWQRKAYGSFS